MWRDCLDAHRAKVYINGVESTNCVVVEVWEDKPTPQIGIVECYIVRAPGADDALVNSCDCMNGEPAAVVLMATVQVVFDDERDVPIVPGNNLGIDPGTWCLNLPDNLDAIIDERRVAYQEVANVRKQHVHARIGSHVELFTPED